MKLRKILSAILTVAMLIAVGTACGNTADDPTPTGTQGGNTAAPTSDAATTEPEPNYDLPPEERHKIVTTIFPQYDWAREIIGNRDGRFELTILIDSSVDMHSYNPSVSDIMKISTADLFIYVGGHSDEEWVEGAIEQATNENMVTISLVEEMGDMIAMIELDDDDDHDDHDHGHGDEDELEEEEHVWNSLRNAQILCEAIAEEIVRLDPEHEDYYRKNLDAYIEKLQELDEKYEEMVDESPVNVVVFGDRFPFLYMMRDYGIEHYEAFTGCSAASEVTPNKIITLAGKIDEHELRYIMITETGDEAIAQSIISATESKDQEILALDGMKAVSAADIANGVTYLSVMESNLEVLRIALS